MAFDPPPKVLYPRPKGISIIRRSIDAPFMIDIARKILDAVDYQGVCGFDFRIAPDGKVYFIECNPRFTGGVRSAAASGLNLPVMLCRLALGKPDLSPHIRTGIPTIVWPELFRRVKQFFPNRPRQVTRNSPCTSRFPKCPQA